MGFWCMLVILSEPYSIHYLNQLSSNRGRVTVHKRTRRSFITPNFMEKISGGRLDMPLFVFFGKIHKIITVYYLC